MTFQEKLQFALNLNGESEAAIRICFYQKDGKAKPCQLSDIPASIIEQNFPIFIYTANHVYFNRYHDEKNMFSSVPCSPGQVKIVYKV